jgi:hypothetical protein
MIGWLDTYLTKHQIEYRGFEMKTYPGEGASKSKVVNLCCLGALGRWNEQRKVPHVGEFGWSKSMILIMGYTQMVFVERTRT